MENNLSVPLLFPLEPAVFLAQIRLIVQEEITKTQKEAPDSSSLLETSGLTQKPLFTIKEVCRLFHVTRPTIYDWVKHGKLKPLKIRSRVYFLGSDIQQLMAPP